MHAAKWNSVAVLDILKEEQDLIDISHNTALMFAAINDSCETIAKLINK